VLQNYPTLFHLVEIIFPHYSPSLIELIKKLSVMMMSVIFSFFDNLLTKQIVVVARFLRKIA